MDSSYLFLRHKEGEDINFVIVVYRKKNCGKREEMVGAERKEKPQGVWKKGDKIFSCVENREVSTCFPVDSTAGCGELCSCFVPSVF